MLDNELILKDENIKSDIMALSRVFKMSENEIIKTGILTNIAYESLPNYKNYKFIISGITQARMIKGVNGKRKIESQLKKLFQTYDLEDINNDLVEKAAELMVITFDSVLTKSGKKVKENYIKALEDIEFLYINLKLAVKIIAESLRSEGISLVNKTLNYITDGIKREKKEIAQKYIDAYLSGEEEQIILARENYRLTMEKMLNNYITTLNVPYQDAVQLGIEKSIVSSLGKENLDLITGYLLLEIKENVMKDSRIQRKLEFK
ncbi:MAG: hypothetical protein ACLUBL_06330 [Fusobacterium sp.]|uniref:hypothetical protein n=1 Tax=Fusobacterium sp. TaxID=68766 RepID=UPI002E77E778|nr:hypothetical protein [Fusobacterium sp.]MEE1476531.1 hypothetical protein [Fusobacterium sp.]